MNRVSKSIDNLLYYGHSVNYSYRLCIIHTLFIIEMKSNNNEGRIILTVVEDEDIVFKNQKK